jgi:hypothetical protein
MPGISSLTRLLNAAEEEGPSSFPWFAPAESLAAAKELGLLCSLNFLVRVPSSDMVETIGLFVSSGRIRDGGCKNAKTSEAEIII